MCLKNRPGLRNSTRELLVIANWLVQLPGSAGSFNNNRLGKSVTNNNAGTNRRARRDSFFGVSTFFALRRSRFL